MEEKKNRVSEKQKKELFYNSKINELVDIDVLDAFWDSCKKNNMQPQDVANALFELYGNEKIKLQKKKIVKEVLVMED